ncbi:hypothetical protein ACIBG8_19375 [Nonomuraea sp. NPDC050556]|uniref:hypothetical protein n=1 Tax=Nonomuraea sp. NPDC050556 TaxID=3364369 RepID=UPI0037BBB241
MDTYIFDWSAPYDGCTPLAVVAASYEAAMRKVGDYCVSAFEEIKSPGKADDLVYHVGSFKSDISNLSQDFEVIA